MPNLSNLIKELTYNYETDLDNPNPVIAVLGLRKTRSLENWISSTAVLSEDSDNLFNTKQLLLCWRLASDPDFRKLYSQAICFPGNLVLTLDSPESDPYKYKRDLFYTNSEIISSACGFLQTVYARPKFSIEFLQADVSKQNIYIYRYYQMIWFAGLRRMLGEQWLQIPATDKRYSGKDIQNAIEERPEFSWDNIPDYRKYGYTFADGKAENINFCAGTKGDLYVE
jgi:hypothetical protein